MKKFEYFLYENHKVTDGMAQLLNRNHFYVAKHKRMTEEELGEIQKKRGTAFSVAAYDGDRCIGMVAAYYSSGQKVTRPYQIYIGTLLVDKFYVLRPAIVVTLFKMAVEQLKNRGIREILSETSQSNKLSFDMLKRHGFVLIDDSIDYYGYYTLHNYMPAIFEFFGEDNLNNETVNQTNFNYHFLPKINRTDRYRVCEFLSEAVIKQEFHLSFGTIFLHINIKYAVVVGLEIEGQCSFVLVNKGRYSVSNYLAVPIDIKICRMDKSAVHSIGSKEKKEIEVPDDDDFTVEVLSRKYTYFTSRIWQSSLPAFENKVYENENYYCMFQVATGFLSVYSKISDELLLKVLWHSVGEPYLEGANIGREKSLWLDCPKNEIIISESEEKFKITSHYIFTEQKIEMNTAINIRKETEEGAAVGSFGQIWTAGISSVFERKPDFADFAFWVEDSKYMVHSLDLKCETALIHLESNAMLLANLPTIGINYGDLRQINTIVRFAADS